MNHTVWLRIDTWAHLSAVRQYYRDRTGFDPINPVANILAVQDRESAASLLMLQYPGCTVTVYSSLMDLLCEYCTEHPKRITKMA